MREDCHGPTAPRLRRLLLMECTKIGYKSTRSAHQAVKAMGNTVRVYRCPNCHQFHVTKERGGRHLKKAPKPNRA